MKKVRHPDSRAALVCMPGIHDSRPLTRQDVLRSSEVAELLNVPKSTVEDWARRNIIPSRKRGRRRFFLRWEVQSWLVADDRRS
jgi:excisionase family DNA binding protein